LPKLPSGKGSDVEERRKNGNEFIDSSTVISVPLTAPTDATMAAICSRSSVPLTTSMLSFEELIDGSPALL